MEKFEAEKQRQQSVTIQSDYKTLNKKDLNEISQKIISSVEVKAGAKLRS